MKKLVFILALIVVAFAVLLPFASTTPDGLETLTAEAAENQQQPAWNGLIAEYSLALGNPYVSTLAAGLLGTGIVLAASYALGVTMTHKKQNETPQAI
jgi:hypothetical protein